MNNQEYVLTENDLIVSKTDLKGIITFVNDDLIRITGYTRDELIGAPHNIFRHPDMPKEAFADLWKTVTEGFTWSGLVKNRTKSGTFYWVRATVTPIYENEKVIGYMSVRRKPNFANVRLAEKLYADIKAGRFKGKLSGGNVLKTDIFHSTLRKFHNLTIKNRLIGLGVLSSFALLAVAAIGQFNLSVLNHNAQLNIDQIEQHTITLLNDFKSSNSDNQEFNQLTTELKALVTQTKANSNQSLAQANTHMMMFMLAILSALIVLFGLTIIGIIRPLHHATDVLKHISNGNYLVRIDNDTRNEIGIMTEALRAMSVRLGFDVAEDRKNINDGLRLKMGLDNVNTGVIIANQDLEIVYVNKAAVNLLREAETDIRKDLPHFNVDTLMGTNIDDFHKNPAHQRQLLGSLTETTIATAIIGGHHMVVKASPIINELGQRLGSVAEWTDRTVEVNLENEISTIVRDAVQGRFSNRLNLEDKKDFFKVLSEELNELLTVSDNVFSDLKRVLSAVAAGNLTQKITANYEGEFNNLKNDTNLAVSQLTNIIEQIKESNSVIQQGISEITQGNDDLANRTENQAANLESAAAAIHQLTTTVHQNDEDAKYANDAVNGVFNVVDKGVKVIGKVVKTMETIHDSSLKVVDIIAVIDSIAFQTNILALNAAVEAARAGDQGRGFAVVATEVQSLAQRAASAAGEIKNLINDSEEKVEDGSKLVVDAGKIMQEIAQSIEGVTSMMARIAIACSEQSTSIEQINSTVMETENMTQQNAALVTEASSASASLEHQIKSLSNTIGYFTVK